MSRRESYKAPLHRSKFMIDFWLGIYQLKQIFVQIGGKNLEKDCIMIPEFFTPSSADSSDRRIDDVDIYDVDMSLANVQALQDSILPEAYTQLLSALQLLHSLRAAVTANLMTTRVTGYIKKKTFSSFLNKSKGAAHLTTDTKLIPDVTSLEYQVCHAVLYILQVEFAEVAALVTAKVHRTLEHLKRILCVTLIELDPSLTFNSLDESGLFLWSNPSFLTSWGAFVTALHLKEDEIRDAAAAAAAAQDAKRKSVLKKIRKSVTNSITSSANKKANDASEHAQNTLYTQVLSLGPLHSAYLCLVEQVSTPSSCCCFQNLTEASNTAPRPRGQSDTSTDSTDTVAPKWYFGKLVGRKPPAERRRAESTSSSVASDDMQEEEGGDFVSTYSNLYGKVFITEEENAAVEVDHRLIHSVVNEAPTPVLPGGSGAPVTSHDNSSNNNNNTDVRLFSWYMYVILHNVRAVTEKWTVILAIHEVLDASKERLVDKRCLDDYSAEGKALLDNVVSTTQIIRSMHNLFTEEVEDTDKLSYKHTVANLCLHVTHHWLKEVQRVHVIVQEFMSMRRKNVSVMIKEAMPICSEEEVEAVVTHDDGVHVHKLITAVNNGHSEVARMLEARLKGPSSGAYSDMLLFRTQADQVLSSVVTLLETPLKHLRSGAQSLKEIIQGEYGSGSKLSGKKCVLFY